ncbi:glycolipid transfer protein-like [Babylonia areolata]|uniref:glycolipid transfer protein-like n=1 Tax=Babylonia areolata TaxID=304850 RepID=UPI003FCF3D43
MAEQLHVEGQFTSVTFFGVCNPKFPHVKEGDQLQTDVFLEASRQILPFIDNLGKAFSLVKKDVQGNVEKIEKHYKKDPEKYKTINAIVEEDQSAEKKGMSDGCVGVLWLRRGLGFFHAIFVELLADVKNNVADENFSPAVSRAYESTLKQFHGWMTQKVIGGVIKLVPYRKDFIKNLMLDASATPEMVLKDVELYDVTLAATILMLDTLLTKNNKNPQEKV